VDEERFNMELRKFLKKFGITAQREIENAVRSAIESGQLTGHETLKVSAVLRVERALEELLVEGEIELG
jgi:hypothetical protein